MVYLNKKIRLAWGEAAAQLGFVPSTIHYGIEGKQGPLSVRVYGSLKGENRTKQTCYEVEFPAEFTTPTRFRAQRSTPTTLERASGKWRKITPSLPHLLTRVH